MFTAKVFSNPIKKLKKFLSFFIGKSVTPVTIAVVTPVVIPVVTPIVIPVVTPIVIPVVT